MPLNEVTAGGTPLDDESPALTVGKEGTWCIPPPLGGGGIEAPGGPIILGSQDKGLGEFYVLLSIFHLLSTEQKLELSCEMM